MSQPSTGRWPVRTSCPSHLTSDNGKISVSSTFGLPIPSMVSVSAVSATGLPDALAVNTFAIASSGIVSGLSWWQALIATALGYSMAAPFLCLNGRPGAVHHIKFPAVARASFGIWLSVWIVIQRVCMSIVWWSGTYTRSSSGTSLTSPSYSPVMDRGTMRCGPAHRHIPQLWANEKYPSGRPKSYHPK